MDPAKLPGPPRAGVGAARRRRDPPRPRPRDASPADDEFDDVVRHVDGYLCALKDAQIRGGLHVLGRSPGRRRPGRPGPGHHPAAPRTPSPSLRATAVAASSASTARSERRVDGRRHRGRCRAAGRRARPSAGVGMGMRGDPIRRCGGWPDRLVPTLAPDAGRARRPSSTPWTGRYVPAGTERGADPRGGACAADRSQLLLASTRRRIPSPLAWEVGRALADASDRAPRRRDGRAAPHRRPRAVGDRGDAHRGRRRRRSARPARRPAASGTAESGRVTGLEVIPLAELGRPRVDVTVRISGFFRDAFPHLVALLDDAVSLVAALDEDAGRTTRCRAAGRRRRPHLRSAARRLRVGDPARHRSGARGAPTPTSPRSTWPGPGSPTAADASASRPRERCAGGSPPSRWRSRTRTTGSTTSSTATTTSRTTAAWSPRSGPSTGAGPAGVVRRHRRPGRPQGASPQRGSGPGRAHPRAQSQVDRRRCAGTATRAPSSWPPRSTTCSATTPPTGVIEDWMYERVTDAYVADPAMRKFFRPRTRGR